MPTCQRQKVQTATRPKSDLELARLGTLAEWFLINDPEWLSDALSLRLETIMRQEQTAHKQLEANMYARRQYADAEQSRMRNTSLPLRLRSQVIFLPEIPSSDNQDHLSALPTDLRLEILSYLFKPHVDPPEDQRSDTDQDAHQHQPPHPPKPTRLRLPHLARPSRSFQQLPADRLEAASREMRRGLLDALEVFADLYFLREDGVGCQADAELCLLWALVVYGCEVVGGVEVLWGL